MSGGLARGGLWRRRLVCALRRSRRRGWRFRGGRGGWGRWLGERISPLCFEGLLEGE